MPEWVGPAIAVSLLVIAIVYLVIGVVVVMAVKQAAEHGSRLGHELGQLRADLAPTLAAVKRLGDKGADVAELAENEAKEIIAATTQLRYDVKRGVRRAKRRLADFDASVEVIQDQIDSAVVEVGTMMATARASLGMIHQLRRMVRPRRRGHS